MSPKPSKASNSKRKLAKREEEEVHSKTAKKIDDATKEKIFKNELIMDVIMGYVTPFTLNERIGQEARYRLVSRSFNDSILRLFRKEFREMSIAVSNVKSRMTINQCWIKSKLFPKFGKFLKSVVKIEFESIRIIRVRHTFKRTLCKYIMEMVDDNYEKLEVFTGLEDLDNANNDEFEKMAVRCREYGPLQLDVLLNAFRERTHHYDTLIVSEYLLEKIAIQCAQPAVDKDDCLARMAAFITPNITCRRLVLKLHEQAVGYEVECNDEYDYSDDDDDEDDEGVEAAGAENGAAQNNDNPYGIALDDDGAAAQNEDVGNGAVPDDDDVQDVEDRNAEDEVSDEISDSDDEIEQVPDKVIRDTKIRPPLQSIPREIIDEMIRKWKVRNVKIEVHKAPNFELQSRRWSKFRYFTRIKLRQQFATMTPSNYHLDQVEVDLANAEETLMEIIDDDYKSAQTVDDESFNHLFANVRRMFPTNEMRVRLPMRTQKWWCCEEKKYEKTDVMLENLIESVWIDDPTDLNTTIHMFSYDRSAFHTHHIPSSFRRRTLESRLLLDDCCIREIGVWRNERQFVKMCARGKRFEIIDKENKCRIDLGVFERTILGSVNNLGQKLYFECKLSETLFDLKKRVAARLGERPEEYVLKAFVWTNVDDSTIGENKLRDGFVIDLGYSSDYPHSLDNSCA